MAEHTVPAPCNHHFCAKLWLNAYVGDQWSYFLRNLYDEYLQANDNSIQARLYTPWTHYWWKVRYAPGLQNPDQALDNSYLSFLRKSFTRYSTWLMSPQDAWHHGADFPEQAPIGNHEVCYFDQAVPAPAPPVVIDLVSDSDTDVDDHNNAPHVWVRRTKRRLVPRHFDVFITRSDNLNSEDSDN